VDGKWQTLIERTSSPHIKKGIATHRLRVVADVNPIRIYVNDQHLADVTDSCFNQGRIGLYASVFTEESPIVVRTFFDNLKVYVADTK
jgi:hypothetical protein